MEIIRYNFVTNNKNIFYLKKLLADEKHFISQ